MVQKQREFQTRYRTSEDTRVRILVAAQQLIAKVGISAVSYRQIAAAAGQANSNAVQYHFCDKQSLVLEIFRHFSKTFEAEREQMFEKATADGVECDIRSLLKTLLLPYLSVVDQAGYHTYAAFVSQYMTSPRPSGLPYPLGRQENPAPMLKKIMELIYLQLDFLPDFLIRPRLQTATLAFTGSIMRWDSEPEEVKNRHPLILFAEDAIEQISAGIMAPARVGERDRA